MHNLIREITSKSNKKSEIANPFQFFRFYTILDDLSESKMYVFIEK
jgi:hypothetical protein